MTQNVRIAAVLVAVVVLSACGRRQPVAQPVPTPPPPVEQPVPTPPPAAVPVRDDAAEREEAMRRMRAVLEQVVYFDFDESTIRADAQESLAAKVPILRQNPGIRIRIEGHADERGSVEYNLALGMRRAVAVREYLVGFGIDAARFEVISYGEDRPAAQGSDEAAWALNRRAEFRITGGM
jgi:peptidoglycan-associated lipoprotein